MLEKAVKVGDTLHYALFYRHPESQEVLFPDTSYRPGTQLEVLRKQFFPTVSKSGYSVDSAVYTIRTFEVAPAFPLRLPVYIYQGGDTLIENPKPVLVHTKSLLGKSADELALKDDNSVIPLRPAFNFLYLTAGFLLVGAVVLVTFLVFGQRIKRAYRLYTLDKEFRSFQNRFNSLVRRFARLESVPVMEEAIVLWKNYLTELEDHPINSYTTTEIATYYNQDAISQALKLCDRAIYGNIVANQRQEASSALQVLLNFASERFNMFKAKLSETI